MPTPNLFLVTQTLTRLLEFNVKGLLDRYGYAPTLNVTSMPPERVGTETDTLNLYLYHTMEASHFRNEPPPGTGARPVSRTPLALSLYYILTAHHQKNDVFDAEIQQLLFGLAMKTFHDFPCVRDDLALSPGGGAPAQPVMPAELIGRDNRFDIAMRPLTAEEALTFWHADDSATTRLAAYYEVRPVFLDPEPMASAAGIALSPGLFLSAGMPPQIDASSALVAFAPPPASGLPAVSQMMSPARPTLATGLTEGPVNRVALAGTRLNGGGGSAVDARILLRSPHWQTMSPPVQSVRLDPALNPAWNVQLGATAALFDFQSSIATSAGNLDVVPGFYTVTIEVERFRDTPSGATVSTRTQSNMTVIALGPRVLACDPPNGAGRIVIHLAPLFDVTDSALDLQLAVDGLLYDELGAFAGAPAADAGHFVRVASDRIEFHPAFAVVAGEAHPVRVVVNGAESQPAWAVMP